MSYPIGWDLVNITGTYVGRNGVPCVGSVTLSSPQLVLRSGTIVPAADIVFDLVNGTFSGQIPATDDPNASPVGWTYTVTENVPGGRQGYQIVAPHTSPGIDLSTVVPVTMPQPPTYGFPYVTLSQLASTGVGQGAALIGFIQQGTGAVSRTVLAKDQEIQLSVEDFGAVGNGTTLDDTAFADAYAALVALGGGTMQLQAKTYALSVPLVIAHSNISIVGKGGAISHDGGTQTDPATKLVWKGASAATVLTFQTPSGTGNARAVGGGARLLEIDCQATAATGLYVHSWFGGRFEDLFVLNPTGQAYFLSAYVHGTIGEAGDTQHNKFLRCLWRAIDTAAVQSAHGFVLTSDAPGTALANSSFNTFEDCNGRCYNGDGFHLVDCDNNDFFKSGCSPTGTGSGVALLGAYGNAFYGWSGNPVSIKGTASGAFANSINNIFISVDESNGTTFPTADAGCTFQWNGHKYGWVNLITDKAVVANSQANALAELANIGNDSLRISNTSASGYSLTDGTSTWTWSQDASHNLRLINSGGTKEFDFTQGTTVNLKMAGVGFFGTSPITTKPTVTGSKGGNAALASLMTALASLGLVTDSTT